MTKYNVHLFREMRLYFHGIEADSPQDAARIASQMHMPEAEDVAECEGDNFSAIVDEVSNRDVINSEVIDFEPRRMEDVNAELLASLEALKDAGYLSDIYIGTAEKCRKAIANARRPA